jgi:predicted enzyme related to lactoylglutathione lyase
MKRVTGIGGLFFKSDDPKKMYEWYDKHLGIKSNDYGTVFQWREKEDKEHISYTVWSAFKKESTYFNPSEKQFMFNYRVENLVELMKVLKEEGVAIVGEIEEFSYGKFGWILDPEGNKIELWEPVDDVFQKENGL